MYSVVVVEDEPSSAQHICSLIRLKSPDFQVAACADNGLDGLEKIRELKPDLVITDIKMPMMDGLEMISRAKSENPLMAFIIVSGYQDFNYAKTAIKLAPLDYLLKPISPAAFQAAMEEASSKIDRLVYQKRLNLVRSLSAGHIPDHEDLQKYFPWNGYYAAVFRHNGLPSRFSHNSGTEVASGNHELLFLYGRDEWEGLYICPKELINAQEFERLIRKKTDTGGAGQFTTLVFYLRAFAAGQLPEVMNRLYKTLTNRLVIGKSQILHLDEKKEDHPSYFATDSIENIKYFARNGMYENLKQELKKRMMRYQQEEWPQVLAENETFQFFTLVFQCGKNTVQTEELRLMIEDAFFYAASFEELQQTLLDILKKLNDSSPCKPNSIDHPEFFESVCAYLKEHMAEDLSLQVICKVFSISQTYMSRLFRKYSDKSFNQYLTEIRIGRSRELISEFPDLLIKEVASMVGYRDQFYFSRLFRSVTGQSPSEYGNGFSE